MLRRGTARVAGLSVAGLALAGAVVVLITGGSPGADLLVVVGLLVTLAAARATLGVHVDLPGASAPRRPVLFFNPKSGGGKAERFKVADEARARGIEPIELGPPWDLEKLVRDAVAAAPTGWRWPAATARRPSSLRSPRSSISLRLYPGGHAQPFRARPRR